MAWAVKAKQLGFVAGKMECTARLVPALVASRLLCCICMLAGGVHTCATMGASAFSFAILRSQLAGLFGAGLTVSPPRWVGGFQAR